MTHEQLLRNLQTELWELYKDVTGFRPRHWKDSDWLDIDFLQTQHKSLMAALQKMQDDDEQF